MTPSKQLDNDLQNRVGILGDGVSKERIERAAEVITNTGIVIRGGGALHVAEKILTTDDSAALQIAEKLAVALRGSEQLLQDAQDIMRSNLVPNGISNKDAIAAYIALLDNTRQRAVQTATHKALAAWNTRTTPTSSAGQEEAVAGRKLQYHDGIVYWLYPDRSHRGLTSEDVETINSLFKASGAEVKTRRDFNDSVDLASQVNQEHIAGLVAKNDELRDALLDMVWQFCSRNDKLAHSFMSAEEHAFDVLDLDNGMTYEEAEAASKAAALPPEMRGK